ncbi:MAG: carboxypeptidase-like regulatory domain-containing protein [Candidatus Micrarchaeota archaeon]
MDLLALLLKVYFGVEGVYYKACDLLQKIHLPVYSWFVNPLEKRGVPSFLVFLFIVFVALVGGVVYSSVSQPYAGTASLEVIVYAPSGERVDGAQVTVLIKGETFSAETQYGSAFFSELPRGQQATVRVEKQGYEPDSQKIIAGGNLVHRASLVRSP